MARSDGEDKPCLPSQADPILEAQTRWDNEANSWARWFRRWTVFVPVGLLVPGAVLLLTVQVLAFPRPGPVSVALIAFELLFLAAALLAGYILPWASPRVRARWVTARLRAEVLRREAFLLCARVGPYVHCDSPPRLQQTVTQRLASLAHEAADPIGCLPLEDQAGVTWRDQLEDAGVGATVSPEPGCLTTCLEKRVRYQRLWYDRKSHELGKRDDSCEAVASLVLFLAFMLAAMHLAILLTVAYLPHLKLAVEIAAIVLPGIGAGAVAVRSVNNWHELSRAYQYYAGLLVRVEADLAALDQQAAMMNQDDFEFKLKRLVLRAEEILASELGHWYVTMKP